MTARLVSRQPIPHRMPGLPSLGIMWNWMGRAGSDFKIAALDGRRISLIQVRGKIVLLHFWTTWCGACIREMPMINRLHLDFQDEDLALLAVNFREPPARVETFRNRHRIECPILLDREGEVGDAYGVLAIPATFILDREGMLIGKATGARDWSTVTARQFIRELLRADRRVASSRRSMVPERRQAPRSG